MSDNILREESYGFSQDQRAEFALGALVCVVVALLLAMFGFVLHEAWPSFSHNGLAWFGGGGNVDGQIQAIFTSGDLKQAAVYTFHAWPLIWSTILITGAAVAIAFVGSLFVAVFMVEFAPLALRRVLEPVVRLLASVPSVIYGLLGVLVLVPFIGNHLITEAEKASVTPTIQLSGSSVLAAVVVLTVMISPVMIAVFADGLRRCLAAGSRARWRSASTAGALLEGRGADGAPRAGGRDRAGHRARSGRGGDARAWSAAGSVRAQPRRRSDLPVRAVTPAGGDDLFQHEQLSSRR